MRVYKVFICIILVVQVLSLKAQFREELLPTFSVGVGYSGELFTHAGFTFFGEYALTSSQNQMLTRISVIRYRHKYHTKNWMLLPEFVFRRNTKKMNFIECSIGPGWLYQVADSRVMEYNVNQYSETKKGWSFFTPSIAFRGGKSFYLKNNHLIVPSLGIRVFGQYPFNDDVLWKSMFDFSISYNLL